MPSNDSKLYSSFYFIFFKLYYWSIILLEMKNNLIEEISLFNNLEGNLNTKLILYNWTRMVKRTKK